MEVQVHNAGQTRAARNRLRLTVRQINGAPAARMTEVTLPPIAGRGHTWALIDASGMLPQGVALRSTTFHLEVDATLLVRESNESNNDKWHNRGLAADAEKRASPSAPKGARAARPAPQKPNEAAGNSDASGDPAPKGVEAPPALPILVVDRIEGRPGSSLRFEGRGFCGEAGCSPVSIFIDGLPVAEGIRVRSDGTLSAQGMVPAVSAAGPVRIEAVQKGRQGEEIRGYGELIVTVKPNLRTKPE